jgi:hypothetical protein
MTIGCEQFFDHQLGVTEALVATQRANSSVFPIAKMERPDVLGSIGPGWRWAVSFTVR